MLHPTVCFLATPVSELMQTLKIIRYTSRLIAAVSPPGSEQRKRFEALQSSVGTSRWAAPTSARLSTRSCLVQLWSLTLPLLPVPPTTHRKAYRLGKFLQDVNGLRRVRLAGGHLALLEAVVYLGEGLYYFLDQFTW